MARLIQCPDCRHEISKQAPVCPKCGRSMKRPASKNMGCCGVIVALGFVVLVGLILMGSLAGPPSQPTRTPPTPSPVTPRVQVGDHAILDPPGAGSVMLAADDVAWTEMIDAQNSGRSELLDRLASQGRAFREARGNRVLVVKTGLSSALVRVVSGLHDGAEGWVQIEFLRPETPADAPE